ILATQPLAQISRAHRGVIGEPLKFALEEDARQSLGGGGGDIPTPSTPLAREASASIADITLRIAPALAIHTGDAHHARAMGTGVDDAGVRQALAPLARLDLIHGGERIVPCGPPRF